jgi:hypothetical protein
MAQEGALAFRAVVEEVGEFLDREEMPQALPPELLDLEAVEPEEAEGMDLEQ